MENREFKKLVSRLLEPYEFKRVKNLWHRRKDGVLAIVRIEKNSYCAGWYMNCGVEFAHTEYEMNTFDSGLDFGDLFVFPSSPPSDDGWKKYEHTIPRKSPVTDCIQLDIFSDEEIEEYLRFNMERSLVPLLTKDSLLKRVHDDPYYLYIGKEKNLPRYGFSAGEIQEKNIHCR